METQDDIRVEFHSRPRLLRAVRGLIRGYASGMGFGADRLDEIVLAVDEACANAMRHSYGGAEDGCIVLILRQRGAMMELEIVDEGKPAPRDRIVQKSLACPDDMDQLRPGGLGVQLIYSVFDEVMYEPGTKTGNRVLMRLACPQGDLGKDHGT